MEKILGYSPPFSTEVSTEKFYTYFESGGVFDQLADKVMVYGSTALGLADRRSDLDVLLGYGDDERIAEVFTQTEKRFHTPVEIYLLDRSAKTHHIDPFFVDHLKAVQADPRWSAGWPVDHLKGSSEFTSTELRIIATGYMERKATEFQRAQLQYRGKVNLYVFQRALELPIALARKTTQINEGMPADLRNKPDVLGQFMLRLASYENSYRELSIFDASWQPVEEASAPPTLLTLEDLEHLTRPTTRRTDVIRKLIQMNIAYDGVLDETIATRDFKGYKTWLSEQYPVACKLAKSAAEFCALSTAFTQEEINLPDIQAALEQREADKEDWLNY